VTARIRDRRRPHVEISGTARRNMLGRWATGNTFPLVEVGGDRHATRHRHLPAPGPPENLG
jgi:hypothetical protein